MRERGGGGERLREGGTDGERERDREGERERGRERERTTRLRRPFGRAGHIMRRPSSMRAQTKQIDFKGIRSPKPRIINPEPKTTNH